MCIYKRMDYFRLMLLLRVARLYDLPYRGCATVSANVLRLYVTGQCKLRKEVVVSREHTATIVRFYLELRACVRACVCE